MPWVAIAASAVSAGISLYQGFAAADVARSQAGALANNTKLQLQIADREYAMARANHDHYMRCFRGRECTFAFQAFATSAPQAQYILAQSRVQVRFNREVQNVRSAHTMISRSFRLGAIDQFEQRYAQSRSISEVDIINNAYRYEEAREISLRDRSWNRKTNAVELGRTLAQDSATISGSAQRMLSEIGAQLQASYAASQKAAGAAFSSAITSIGGLASQGVFGSGAQAFAQIGGVTQTAATVGSMVLMRAAQ